MKRPICSLHAEVRAKLEQNKQSQSDEKIEMEGMSSNKRNSYVKGERQHALFASNPFPSTVSVDFLIKRVSDILSLETNNKKLC